MPTPRTLLTILPILPIGFLALMLLAVQPCVSGSDDPDIRFLSTEDAKVAIVDETVEPYFSLLQTQEMACKTAEAMPSGTLEIQRDVCRQRYAKAVGSFSQDEQAAIRTLLATVTPHLKSAYPLFAAEPWRFIKLDPRFEGGMPCTRGHCIILSEAVLPQMVAQVGRQFAPAYAMMLVHEQTHVMQRLHPAIFQRLYTQVLGFVRMPQEPQRSADLIAHQLLNPDGIACVWAYPLEIDHQRQLIEPQLILGVDTAVPRMPEDFSVIALPLDGQPGALRERQGSDGQPVVLKLEDLNAYVSAFTPCDEYFHPNEISAVIFSLIVAKDVGGVSPAQDTPCMRLVRGWAASDLGDAPPGQSVQH